MILEKAREEKEKADREAAEGMPLVNYLFLMY